MYFGTETDLVPEKDKPAPPLCRIFGQKTVTASASFWNREVHVWGGVFQGSRVQLQRMEAGQELRPSPLLICRLALGSCKKQLWWFRAWHSSLGLPSESHPYRGTDLCVAGDSSWKRLQAKVLTRVIVLDQWPKYRLLILDKIQLWDMASHNSKSPFWVSTKSHCLPFLLRRMPCWEQRLLHSHSASPILSFSSYSLASDDVKALGDTGLLVEPVCLLGCITSRGVLHHSGHCHVKCHMKPPMTSLPCFPLRMVLSHRQEAESTWKCCSAWSCSSINLLQFVLGWEEEAAAPPSSSLTVSFL